MCKSEQSFLCGDTSANMQERERMTELGWLTMDSGGVEVFEEQMLGDQGVP